MGVDCVIADCPNNTCGVEQKSRNWKISCYGAVAHKSAEVKGKAEEDLRVPCDALHEGIGRNEWER